MLCVAPRLLMLDPMRLLAIAVALTACSGSTDELEPTAQGPCSNLDDAACRADDRCQLAYVDSGFQPQASPMHCLELESGPVTSDSCPQDHDGCRARPDCSPVFFQELGPDDGPVGEPYYQRCTAEADLVDLGNVQGACSNLDEQACRAAASCQPLYIVAGGAPGPWFANCLHVASPAASTASCPQDRAGCRMRPDCATVFEQAKGPTDGNVGDPYYLRCDLESTIEGV